MFCVVLSDLFFEFFQFFFDFVFDLPLPSPEKGLIAFDTVDLRDVKKNIHQNSSFPWPNIGLYPSLVCCHIASSSVKSFSPSFVLIVAKLGTIANMAQDGIASCSNSSVTFHFDCCFARLGLLQNCQNCDKRFFSGQ